MGGQPGLLLVLGSKEKAQHELMPLPNLLWSKALLHCELAEGMRLYGNRFSQY